MSSPNHPPNPITSHQNTDHIDPDTAITSTEVPLPPNGPPSHKPYVPDVPDNGAQDGGQEPSLVGLGEGMRPRRGSGLFVSLSPTPQPAGNESVLGDVGRSHVGSTGKPVTAETSRPVPTSTARTSTAPAPTAPTPKAPTTTAFTPTARTPTAPRTPSQPPRRAGQSIFSKIRNLQNQSQNKKASGNQINNAHLYTPIPDSETYLEAVMPSDNGKARAYNIPHNIDHETEAHKNAVAEFQKKKKYYDDLRDKHNGALPFRLDVDWLRIQREETNRLNKRKRDLRKAQEDEQGEPGLFPDEGGYQQQWPPQNNSGGDENETENNDDEELDFDPAGASSHKRKRVDLPRKASTQYTSMAEAELESMKVALDAEKDLPRKKAATAMAVGPSGTRKSTSSKTGSGRAAKSKGVSASGGKKTGKSNHRKSAKEKRAIEKGIHQVTSLFSSNVFEQQAPEGAPDQPTFTSRNKQSALKELLASIPVGTDKTAAKGDMGAILAATKDFTGHGAVKADGNGLWRVRGMTTSLKPYQVLGSAFMRRREIELDQPRGGLMADQMGLGKTLMMLANIVNGLPPKGDEGPRTTLLVASPALCSQWAKEITAHTNCNLKVMRYGTGNRLDSNQTYRILNSHDIILTTYSEIMKSYPRNEPPIDCQTAEQKIAWWKEVYESERGVLHRMQFLRVVLDEAQAIKNHTSRTSISCRAIMAEHRWALSGTPILNSLTELYPYFKFLGVPHTGSFKIFKHNYCDTGNAENAERLLVRLSQFMIRRTHADQMFGAPILRLPTADQGTYWCTFNVVERNVYDIVRQRFAKSINMMAQKGDFDRSYSCALVMLLRLRQLTSHILMLQFVMRDLLEREDIERIRQVVADAGAETTSTHQGRTIVAIRKQLDALATEEKKRSRQQEKTQAVEEEEEFDELDEEESSQIDGGTGRAFGKNFNFKPFLNSLSTGESWEKAKKKAVCSCCGHRPREPWITTCGHLMCQLCYDQILVDAAESCNEAALCKECGTRFQARQCELEPDDEVQSKETRSKRKKREQEQKRVDREDIADDWLTFDGKESVLPSAKTIAIKAQIINWIKENKDVKIIIYTQFLAMIRILGKMCQEEGWTTEQYHGKMSFPSRDKAISNFAEKREVRVFLASLRCGGLGLNLTMASRVILIDPWWNSAAEQQAFCRVFRIGQKEPTFMTRFCVRNTVDQRLIEMQDRKKKEIDGVMEDQGKTVGKLSTRDLMRLFGNLDEDEEGKPFILVDNPDPRGGFRAHADDEGYADEN